MLQLLMQLQNRRSVNSVTRSRAWRPKVDYLWTHLWKQRNTYEQAALQGSVKLLQVSSGRDTSTATGTSSPVQPQPSYTGTEPGFAGAGSEQIPHVALAGLVPSSIVPTARCVFCCRAQIQIQG